jgi:prepilin-type N-terminal cleavage/methylation domain-containing protein
LEDKTAAAEVVIDITVTIAIARNVRFRYRALVMEFRQNTRWQSDKPPGSHPRGGFSLIELLITMVVLIVLMSMYWGPGSKNRQREQIKRCQRNLQKIYVAMEIYAMDSGEKFPFVPGAKTSEEAMVLLVPRYTADTSIFICPGGDDSSLSGESLVKQKISYAYYMGRRSSEKNDVLMSDRQVDTRPKSAGDPVFSSNGEAPGNNHHKYGGNFLFCDGRLESISAPAPFPLAYTPEVELLNPKP